MAGPSSDLLNISYDETEAVFADLSWDVTEKLTLGVGMRHARGQTPRYRPDTARYRDDEHSRAFPWDDPEYNLRDPFGYSAINTPLAGASNFDETPARLSVQYQFTDDLMTYVTVAERLRARAARQHRADRTSSC